MPGMDGGAGERATMSDTSPRGSSEIDEHHADAPRARRISAARSGGRPEPGRGAVAPDGRPSWDSVREELRSRGLRWTAQRRILVDVLSRTGGHITGSDLVERCREIDPTTIPSTVYRTLDVLEEMGLVQHCHAFDGREEFHVMPEAEHGHLYCSSCGAAWGISAAEAATLVAAMEAARGFAVDLSHMTVVGTCARCRDAAKNGADAPDRG
jgi:Fur family transcriptional regulator, ferric uptake regulator